MFTDTHFHLHRLFESDCDCKELLSTCVKNNFPFLLDIGTDSDDLPIRVEIANKILNQLDEEIKQKVKDILFLIKANAPINTDAYSYALEQGYEDARETAAVSSEKHGAFNNWAQTDESKYAYGDHFLVNDRARVQKTSMAGIRHRGH